MNAPSWNPGEPPDGDPAGEAATGQLGAVLESFEQHRGWLDDPLRTRGDMVVPDNFAVSHGQPPYHGPREVVFA